MRDEEKWFRMNQPYRKMHPNVPHARFYRWLTIVGYEIPIGIGIVGLILSIFNLWFFTIGFSFVLVVFFSFKSWQEKWKRGWIVAIEELEKMEK